MNVLKTAIAGLALIAVTTPSSADVITDWNQAAMDVMKAVNVAGNPWTRTLAMMHVAMSDAVNAVHNRYTRSDPGDSGRPERLRRGRCSIGRTRNPHAPISRPKGADRRGLRGHGGERSGQSRQGGRHCSGRKSRGRSLRRPPERRDKRPDTYRPLTRPGVWVPTTPPLFSQYATAKPWGMDSATSSARVRRRNCRVLSMRTITTKPRSWAG